MHIVLWLSPSSMILSISNRMYGWSRKKPPPSIHPSILYRTLIVQHEARGRCMHCYENRVWKVRVKGPLEHSACVCHATQANRPASQSAGHACTLYDRLSLYYELFFSPPAQGPKSSSSSSVCVCLCVSTHSPCACECECRSAFLSLSLSRLTSFSSLCMYIHRVSE